MTTNIVRLGPEYLPNPFVGRPLASASIYIGVPDLDPQIPANQKQLYVQQESGAIIPVSQPILTGAGGLPEYGGSPVTLLVDGAYSIKVLDAIGAQAYYIPSYTGNDTFANLDELRAISPLGGQTGLVEGHTDPGDGGGGYFVYISGAAPGTYVDDDGTIIVPTGGDGSAAWLRSWRDPKNLVELRAYPGFASMAITVLGHTDMGDGGGGEFIYFSGAAPGTYVDDNGIIIVPNGGDGSAAWVRDYTDAINVRWFGAVGAGDESDVLTAALNAGNIILVPQGMTIISSVAVQDDFIGKIIIGGGVLNIENEQEIRSIPLVSLPSNWVADVGGRNIAFNPESLHLPTLVKNSNIVLGGRSPGYEITLGEDAELSFHGGGGDTLLNHLAGTICGGAHHIMDQTLAGDGSHGFIGGGSYNSNYGDYAAIVGGTGNTVWATRGTLVGGAANTIGADTDRLIGEGGFIGGGQSNILVGKYASILNGELCSASAAYSEVSGYGASSVLYGAKVRASGTFSTLGDAQAMDVTLRRTTTNNVATQLLLDGSSAALDIGSETLWVVKGTVQGQRTDTGTEAAAYEIVACIQNAAGVTTLRSQTVTTLYEADATWAVTLVASSGRLEVRVTGAVGKTVEWFASLHIAQTRNI